jgi:hypothetical protein
MLVVLLIGSICVLYLLSYVTAWVCGAPHDILVVAYACKSMLDGCGDISDV